MKRVTIVAVFCGLFSMGCGGDSREAHINNVLNYVNNTSSHLSTIKNKLSDTIKKEKVTTEDVKDALDAADKMKEEGKKLLDLQRRINADTDRAPLSKDEMEAYKTKFKNSIEQALLKCQEETAAVTDLVEKLEDKNKAAALELRKKLRDAQGEFQQVVSAK